MESVQLDRSKLTLERTEHVFRCVQFEGVCAPVCWVCPTYCGKCAPVWWVCHCMVGCTLVWEDAPVWEDVSSVGGCVLLWESASRCGMVSQCGRVFPSVGGCLPV